MLLPQIPHAVEMGSEVMLTHAWRAPVSAAKGAGGAGGTCWKLTINSGERADQYCSQARNYLSIAFNNGAEP